MSGSGRRDSPRVGRVGAGRGATPREAHAAHMGSEDHGYLVRALLRAADGKHQPDELFEALAIPIGMALSSLFTMQDRTSERLDALERRLSEIEERLGVGRPPAPGASPVLGRILDKLDVIEARLGTRHDDPIAAPRRDSPIRGGGTTPERRRRSPSGTDR